MSRVRGSREASPARCSCIGKTKFSSKPFSRVTGNRKKKNQYKGGVKIPLAELGLEVSDFVNKYKEHLTRETEFIFFIADGLNF